MPSQFETPIIRLARESDATAIADIYAPIVRETWISFEMVPPTPEQMHARMQALYPAYPWLVCEHKDEILGYVYASPHAERAAYRWSVNVTVYIHSKCRRMGLGRALYTSLFNLIRLQGYFRAYAGITLPNEGSVGLHESMGFKSVAKFESVGFKFGSWLDVGWLQLSLSPLPEAPAMPRPVDALVNEPEWEIAMNSGLSLLQGPK